MSNLVVGSIFDDKYEIVSVLGVGGIGTVYKAREIELNRDVAIKVLNVWSGAEEQMQSLQRFRREAKTLSQLQHTGILQVYKFGVDEVPFLVTEFVEGQSLREILEKEGAFDFGTALQIAIKLAEALAYAHANGIVHRDLKPENVLLDLRTKPLVLKLIDFGLCKPDGGGRTRSNTLTGTGELIGTAGYMSPEQVRGLPVDGRSDIYSFACIMFELFTGKQALQDVNLPDLLLRQLNEPLPEILDLNPDCGLPAGVDKLIQYCSKKDPQDRPADFNEVLELLKALKVASPEKKFQAAKVSATERKKRKALLKIVLLSGLGLTVLSLGFIAYGFFSTPGQFSEISVAAVSTLLKVNKSDAAGKLALQQVESKQFLAWSAAQKSDLLYKYFQLFRQAADHKHAQDFLVRFLKIALPQHSAKPGRQDLDWQRQIEEAADYLFSREVPRSIWKELAPAFSQADHDDCRSWFSGRAGLLMIELVEESGFRSWGRPPADVVDQYVKRYSTGALDALNVGDDIMYKRFIERALTQSREWKFFALEAFVYAVMCEYSLRKNDLKTARKDMLACEDLLLKVKQDPDLDTLKYSFRQRIINIQYELYKRLLAEAASENDKEASSKWRKKLLIVAEDERELKDETKEDRRMRDDLFEQTFKL